MFETLYFSLKIYDTETIVSIAKKGRSLMASATKRVLPNGKPVELEHSHTIPKPGQWMRDWEALDVTGWTKKLLEKAPIPIEWGLELTFSDRLPFSISGKSACPAHWFDFLELLDAAVPEVGLIGGDTVDVMTIELVPNGWHYPEYEGVRPIAESFCLERERRSITLVRSEEDEFEAQVRITIDAGIDDLLDGFSHCLNGFKPTAPQTKPGELFCLVTILTRGHDRYELTFPYRRGSLPPGWEEVISDLDEIFENYSVPRVLTHEEIYGHGMGRNEVMIVHVGIFGSKGEVVECWTDDDSYYPGQIVYFRKNSSRHDQKGMLLSAEYVKKSQADISGMAVLTGHAASDLFDEVIDPRSGVIKGDFGRK